MLVKTNPETVIGKTWSETKEFDWMDCYPIITLNSDKTDGEITGIYTIQDIGNPEYAPVEMRGGKFVRMIPDEVENGNPDAFIEV